MKALALAAALVSALVSADDGAPALTRARALFKKEDYAAAAREYERAEALRPSVETAAELGMVFDQLGRRQDAAQAYLRALGRSDSYPIRVRLAQDYVWLGRMSEARVEFAAAKRLRGRESDAYIREGYADMAVGDDQRAEADFARLMASGNPEGYHHMAVLRFRQGRAAEAERYVREAVRLFDEQPLPRRGLALTNRLHAGFWLGVILEGRGKRREAETAYRRGLAQAEDDPSFEALFLQQLARLDAADKRFAEAETEYKRALAACQPPAAQCLPIAPVSAMDGLAGLYVDEGRERDAAVAARAALFLWKAEEASWNDGFCDIEGDCAALNALAGVFLRLGDAASARRVYRDVLRVAPRLPASGELKKARAGLADLTKGR